MNWWSYPWRRPAKRPDEPIRCVRLNLPEWTEDSPKNGRRIWQHADGCVLHLGTCSEPFADFDIADEIQRTSVGRHIAEISNGGLVEVQRLDRGIKLIYKRRDGHACIYTGVLFMRVPDIWLMWAIVATEHGITGVREAFVIANLIKSGDFTPEEFEQRWARDPYDPAYTGMDRRVLRSMSDDEIYDRQFPEHPLSKVRRILAALPANVEYDSSIP